MNKTRFIIRLISVMCAIAVFQLISCELFVFQVIHPTFKDLVSMLTIPGPVLVILLSIFFLCVYFYIRKILRFLNEFSMGQLNDTFVEEGF